MKLALTLAALLITGSDVATSAPCYIRDHKGEYIYDKGRRLRCGQFKSEWGMYRDPIGKFTVEQYGNAVSVTPRPKDWSASQSPPEPWGSNVTAPMVRSLTPKL